MHRQRKEISIRHDAWRVKRTRPWEGRRCHHDESAETSELPINHNSESGLERKLERNCLVGRTRSANWSSCDRGVSESYVTSQVKTLGRFDKVMNFIQTDVSWNVVSVSCSWFGLPWKLKAPLHILILTCESQEVLPKFRPLGVVHPLLDVFLTWERQSRECSWSRSGPVIRDDTRSRRVVIVFASFIRCTLPRTSFGVVWCIIHIHHQTVFEVLQFCKSRILLCDTIFQLGSMSSISKSNQYIQS